MREQQIERMRQQHEQARQQHQQQHERTMQQHGQRMQQHEQNMQQHQHNMHQHGQKMQQLREQQMQQHAQKMEQIRQQAVNSGTAYTSHPMPGYWPDEKHEYSIPVTSQDHGDQIAPSGAAAAKYRSIMGIETSIEQQLAAAEKAAPGPEKEALEWAVAEMLNQLEVMRMEADEEYAKELAGQ